MLKARGGRRRRTGALKISRFERGYAIWVRIVDAKVLSRALHGELAKR